MVFDTHLFIKRIQAYPEIFDTNNPRFKQVDDKNGAWDKLAVEFKVDGEEFSVASRCIIFYRSFTFPPTANFCRKKFRTLRERYTRELRKSYLEPTVSVKYEYFKELSFLTPYIKFRSISFESADGKTIVTKREDSMLEDKDQTAEDLKLLEQEGYYTEEQEQHAYHLQESGSQNIIYESTTIEHVPEFSGNSHQIHEVVHQSDEENLSSQKQLDRKRKEVAWDMDDQEDDKYFAMSIACSLKRLSTINNLKAKVEIFQVIEKFSSRELDKKWLFRPKLY